jgi:hypothetical protein
MMDARVEPAHDEEHLNQHLAFFGHRILDADASVTEDHLVVRAA